MHVIITPHENIGLGAVANGREIHSQRRFAIGTDLAGEVDSFGNGDGIESAGSGYQTAQRQPTRDR